MKKLEVPDIGMGHCRYATDGKHHMRVMLVNGDNVIMGCDNSSFFNLQMCPLGVNVPHSIWQYLTSIGIKYQMEKSLERLFESHGTV